MSQIFNTIKGAQQPFWWDDTGVICGNVQQNLQMSTCGRCGDAPGNTFANQGGRYDKGIITGTYTAGSVSVNFNTLPTAPTFSFSQLDHPRHC